ncbi:MAG: hypothetical protein HY778_15450 [Betaproteobacteria bacterium]|nr:hypothetical protein [Betaproteobacteria bacterium]
MSIDYIFFDDGLRARFLQFVSGLGIETRVRADQIEGSVVELPDDLTDAVAELVDGQYESLMDEQLLLAEAQPDLRSKQVAGVTVTLPDGRPCVVRLPGPLARRLLEHFDTDEINALVSVIAESLHDPGTGPLCRET